VDGEAREDERRDAGGRARDGDDRQISIDGAPHEQVARVGDARHAGIADHGDRLALPQELDDPLAGPILVELVERELRLLDVEVLEQQSGLARVLAGDIVDLPQRLKRADGDIAEVADRCRDQVEHLCPSRKGGSLSGSQRGAPLPAYRPRCQYGPKWRG
jgi:hypothetical protein